MKAIAAMARGRVIGADGGIPWHLPGDLRFFKRVTTGHVVVMGRRTWESLGRPLPGRENWVLTGGPAIEGVRVLRSTDEVRPPGDGREVFVIGGAAVYGALLPKCGELLLTHVDADPAGDTFFPDFEDMFTPAETLERGDGYEIVRYVRTRDDNRPG